MDSTHASTTDATRNAVPDCGGLRSGLQTTKRRVRLDRIAPAAFVKGMCRGGGRVAYRGSFRGR